MLIGAGLLAAPASAGEKLTLEEVAAKTHGAALVKVELARGGQPDRVHLVRVVRGLPAEIRVDSTWFGLCLPHRKSLRGWTVQHAKWPASDLWRRALARGGYQAVVLVEQRPDGARPRCGVEAMQMSHTDLDPGFEVYLKRVEVELDKRGR